MRPVMLAAVLGLAGCVSLLPDPGPAPGIYRLTDAVVEPVMEEAASWIVEVPTPTAPRVLTSDRVAVSVGGGDIAYASGARWEESLPNLFQSLVIERFDASGRIFAAVRPEDGVRAPFELRLEITTFEATYDDANSAAPVVRARIRAKLVDSRSRDLVAARTFDAEERAEEDRLPAIIAAFDAISHDIAADIVSWTVDEGEAAYAVHEEQIAPAVEL